MRLDLIRSGLYHLLRRDIKTPMKFILDSIDDTKREISLVDKIDSTPDYVENAQRMLIVQEGNQYFSLLPNSINNSIQVSSSRLFESIEFGVYNSSQIQSITIDVETTEEDTKTKSHHITSFSNGLYDEDLNHIPISVSFDSPVSEAQVVTSELTEKDNSDTEDIIYVDSLPESDEGDTIARPILTVPTINHAEPVVSPIFLISVDTWRYDYMDAFQPLLEFLGSDATVPDEPRTQGFFTTPSHASMFTGTHPGDHGHTMSGLQNIEPMPNTLTTIGEFLKNNGYKNSGLVSHTRLLPNYGYGRGFDRFELRNKRPSNWMGKQSDARSLVDTICRWVEEDIHRRVSQAFYFVHLFDPHPPFYPPLGNYNRSKIDFAAIETFLDDSTMTADDEDYIQLLENGIEVDKPILDEVKTIYREAVEYTGTQLLTLMQNLDRYGILDDSFVIITGDHGYEFGERGFTGAKSLYDANIRQGMIVKPPTESTWTVPDQCDIIDILPTVAQAVGESPPSHCVGKPWQLKECNQNRPRITERIRAKHYNLAVEQDGVKAIYTYESDPPTRPTEEQLMSGPIHEEYYELTAVRDGNFSDLEDKLTPEEKSEYRKTAEQFASADISMTESSDRSFAQPSQETTEQLRKLGYK